MGPIDYSGAFANLQSPVQAFTQGLEGGLAVQQAGAMQMKLDRQQLLQQTMMKLAQNPTTEGIAQASVMFPELSEQFKRSYDMLTPVQQQTRLNATIPIYTAVQNGRNDLGAQMLRDRAAALENSGQQQEAAQTRAMADLVEQHPETAKLTMGTLLASTMGPEKFTETFKSIGDQQRAAEKQPFEVQKLAGEATQAQAKGAVAQATTGAQVAKAELENQNIASQIQNRADQLGLDRDKLTSETQVRLMELKQKFGQLPDDARKLVNDSAVASTSAEQSLHQYTDLANRIDQLSGSWGAFNTADEFLRKSFGNENARSALQKEYTRIATQGVLKMLPPGPASDKDIAMAREGVPPATAAPEVMASYLRGMAKLSAYDAALNNAKAEWAGSVQHLGRTKEDITIDGVKVPAGTTFNEFARQYLQQKADSTYNGAVVQKRSYMRFANTSAAPGGQ